MIRYRNPVVDVRRVFYRETGAVANPAACRRG
jgi:hypothetical protein